jgi:hypothetical protein
MTMTPDYLPQLLVSILSGERENSCSPRELAQQVSQRLVIPYRDAELLLQEVLGREIPEDNSGTVQLGRPRIIFQNGDKTDTIELDA